jgi:hypothetical protein
LEREQKTRWTPNQTAKDGTQGTEGDREEEEKERKDGGLAKREFFGRRFDPGTRGRRGKRS